MTKKPAFYAVANGRRIDVFRTWDECRAQVEGFPAARYKKFATESEARGFIDNYRKGCASGASSTVIRPCSGSSVKNFSSTATRKRPSEVVPTCGNLPKRLKNCDPTKWEAAPVVYTDGACSNNGRLGAKAGYGVYWGPDHEDNACGPVTGAPTNNRGELLAVDVALKQAIQKGLSYIVIRTDSKLLIESMDSWMQKWKRNNWKTSIGKDVLNQDLLRSIDESTQSIHVKFEHVPGHSGVPGNEAADSLARQGAQMFSSGSNQ